MPQLPWNFILCGLWAIDIGDRPPATVAKSDTLNVNKLSFRSSFSISSGCQVAWVQNCVNKQSMATCALNVQTSKDARAGDLQIVHVDTEGTTSLFINSTRRGGGAKDPQRNSVKWMRVVGLRSNFALALH